MGEGNAYERYNKYLFWAMDRYWRENYQKLLQANPAKKLEAYRDLRTKLDRSAFMDKKRKIPRIYVPAIKTYRKLYRIMFRSRRGKSYMRALEKGEETEIAKRENALLLKVKSTVYHFNPDLESTGRKHRRKVGGALQTAITTILDRIEGLRLSPTVELALSMFMITIINSLIPQIGHAQNSKNPEGEMQTVLDHAVEVVVNETEQLKQRGVWGLTMESLGLQNLSQELPQEYTTWHSLINDYKLRVSRDLLDFFRNGYSTEIEDGYFLLANMRTGVIEKVSRGNARQGTQSVNFERGYARYLDEMARRRGYFVVGAYHSHPNPRTNPDGSRTPFSGDLPSNDDTYSNPDDDVENEAIILLGHGSERLPFETRAFVSINEQSQVPDNPFIERIPEIEAQGRFAVSKYNGDVERRLVEFEIEWVSTGVPIEIDDLDDDFPVFAGTETINIPPETYERLAPFVKSLEYSSLEFNTQISDPVLRVRTYYNNRQTFIIQSSSDPEQSMLEITFNDMIPDFFVVIFYKEPITTSLTKDEFNYREFYDIISPLLSEMDARTRNMLVQGFQNAINN